VHIPLLDELGVLAELLEQGARIAQELGNMRPDGLL
jgi:hypothetical protein